jgi:hypothetical protein
MYKGKMYVFADLRKFQIRILQKIGSANPRSKLFSKCPQIELLLYEIYTSYLRTADLLLNDYVFPNFSFCCSFSRCFPLLDVELTRVWDISKAVSVLV